MSLSIDSACDAKSAVLGRSVGALSAAILSFASLQAAFACETNSCSLSAAPLAPVAPLVPVVLLSSPPPQPATARAATRGRHRSMGEESDQARSLRHGDGCV